MKSYYDRTMEVLHCKGCGEKYFMSTRSIFYQERYVQIVERFALEHQHCDSYHNQDKARRALIWNQIVVLMGSARQRRARVHFC